MVSNAKILNHNIEDDRQLNLILKVTLGLRELSNSEESAAKPSCTSIASKG